jgi:exosortase
MTSDVIVSENGSNVTTIHKVWKSKAWLIAVALCTFVIVYVYWHTFRFWWRNWMVDESYYSHAVLIPFMSAFAIYINRRTISKVEISPSLLGLLVLIPAMIMHMLAYMSNTASGMGLTMPLILLGSTMVLFGMRMTKHLLFPILFLFFMCTLPGFVLAKLSFKIQLMSTTVATQILNLLQLHAQQTGTQISLPNVDVIVGAPCSGFRMLISLVAFAVFFAYMKEGPTWGRISLVLFTAPLSLLANSLRVALIALVGEFFGEDAMHGFHDYSGYIVLLISFVTLWLVAKVVKCEKFRLMDLS